MSQNARTAADFLWWMKEHGFGFRSGFSHLKFEEVVQMYLDHLQEREKEESDLDEGESTPED